MPNKQHWDTVYTTKAADSVSWFQQNADTSLQLIQATSVAKDAAIIDVGGGASTLVDDLILNGYSNLSVLDLSSAALDVAKARIGQPADNVNWIVADITQVSFPEHQFDVWHDRAVFHFLTKPEERLAYVRTVLHAVKPNGHIIIATFAEDGPTQCSGLPVVRYSAESLQAQLGDSFLLKNHFYQIHHTPFGTTQNFIFCHFVKTA